MEERVVKAAADSFSRRDLAEHYNQFIFGFPNPFDFVKREIVPYIGPRPRNLRNQFVQRAIVAPHRFWREFGRPIPQENYVRLVYEFVENYELLNSLDNAIMMILTTILREYYDRLEDEDPIALELSESSGDDGDDENEEMDENDMDRDRFIESDEEEPEQRQEPELVIISSDDE